MVVVNGQKKGMRSGSFIFTDDDNDNGLINGLLYKLLGHHNYLELVSIYINSDR